MGKVKKKSKKKSEFDDFFETAPTEEQWLSGVSAAAMDTDVAAPAEQAAVPVAGEAMDTSEGPVVKRQKGLRVNKTNLKRGQKSTAQRKRKSRQLEKAMSVVDKAGSKVSKQSSVKHRKASLKAIY